MGHTHSYCLVAVHNCWCSPITLRCCQIPGILDLGAFNDCDTHRGALAVLPSSVIGPEVHEFTSGRDHLD